MGKCTVNPMLTDGGGIVWTKLGERNFTHQTMPDSLKAGFVDKTGYDFIFVRLKLETTYRCTDSRYSVSFRCYISGYANQGPGVKGNEAKNGETKTVSGRFRAMFALDRTITLDGITDTKWTTVGSSLESNYGYSPLPAEVPDALDIGWPYVDAGMYSGTFHHEVWGGKFNG